MPHAPFVRSYRCSGLLLESSAACLSAKPLSSQYSPKRHTTVSECVAKYASALSTEAGNMAKSLKYWLGVARFLVFFHRYALGWYSGEDDGRGSAVRRALGAAKNVWGEALGCYRAPAWITNRCGVV
jgi:hypothetical protein